MSGIDEILPWAIENYPLENYGSYEEWFADVAQDFATFSRLPLDEILGDQQSQFEEFYNVRPDDVQTFLDQFPSEP